MDKAPELGREITNITITFWNGQPAWALGIVVLAHATCLCGALYYMALIVLGGE